MRKYVCIVWLVKNVLLNQRQIAISFNAREGGHIEQKTSGAVSCRTECCPVVSVSIIKDLCAFVSKTISLNRRKYSHEDILAVFCIVCILTLYFKKLAKVS